MTWWISARGWSVNSESWRGSGGHIRSGFIDPSSRQANHKVDEGISVVFPKAHHSHHAWATYTIQHSLAVLF